MKKLVAVALTGILSASFLAGCGANSGGQPPVKESGSASSDETGTLSGGQDDDYPVVRMAYSHIFPIEDEEAVEEEMNKILREEAHAEVDLVGIDFSDMTSQMNLLLTGGNKEPLDIFSSFWYLPLNTLKSNGQIAELDDLLKTHPEVLDLFKDNPEVLEACKVDGKLYALPTLGPWSSPEFYFTTKADSDSANIDWSKVNTLDDVTDAMLAMKKVNPDHYYIPGATETYYIPKDIDTLGDNNTFLGVLTDPLNSTKVENYYESDYFMNFMKNVKTWSENGLISPDPMSNTLPTLMSVQNGITSGSPGYCWSDEEWVYEANIQQQYGGDVVGHNYGERLITTSNIQTYLWHITSFSTNKEAAMNVLAALYTDSRLDDIYGNGVEGKNYVLNADGKLEFPEGENNQNNGWTGIGASYSLPNTSECRPWYYQPEDMWDQMMKTNSEAKPSLALGFVFDSTPVADQITACANVCAQYYLPLINGEADIDDTLPAFQQALHDAGIDDIIAEKQSQLDKWLASK
ncbi:protein of unknown function [Lachnospiraceae bacterium NK3A20]|nr:protein of unknown function [Lachnospiraceae bacterium NK3A20]